MLESVKHSYVCSILKKKNIQIFRDGKRILDQLYPHTFPELKTFMKIGYNYAIEYLQDKPIIKSDDYSELNSKGWKIITRNATSEFYDKQRLAYELSPIDSLEQDYGRMPKGYNFELDLLNRMIKFNGKNVSLSGTTGWVPLDTEKNSNRKKQLNPFDINAINSRSNNYFEDRIPDELKNKKNDVWQEIPEVAIGWTEMGELCCMEDTEEPPRSSISGQSGMGKTSLLNNLECQESHKFKWNGVNINDIKGDTQTRCLPWNPRRDMKFIKELARLREPTIPMSYVYLHPTIKTLKSNQIFYEDEVGFKVSFPFKKFILDPNIKGYNLNWGVSPKARKYMINLLEDEKGNELLDGILYKDNLEEIKDLIFGKDGIDGVIPKKMHDTLGNSIYHLIKDVWNRGILDKSTKINSTWTAIINGKKYVNSPWNICLLCGIASSMITKQARNQDWFAMWIKHLLEDIFEFSSSEEYQLLQGKNIIVRADEISQILNNDTTKEIIDKIIREGRTETIGFELSNQFFSDTPQSIITNLTHYFVFRTQSSKDIDFFTKEFKLNKTQINDLRNLKKFECYAFGEFILYDMNGNRYSNDGKAIKIIKTKPPNAQNFWNKRWLEKVE